MNFQANMVGREWSDRTTRIDVVYDAVVRCAAGEFCAQVLNVSRSGFRLRSEQPLEEGWEITVEVARVEPLRAVVRWAAGHDAGGVFVEPAAL